MFDRSIEAKNATIDRAAARKAKESANAIYNEYAIYADSLFTEMEETGIKTYSRKDDTSSDYLLTNGQ